MLTQGTGRPAEAYPSGSQATTVRSVAVQEVVDAMAAVSVTPHQVDHNEAFEGASGRCMDWLVAAATTARPHPFDSLKAIALEQD